jgi:hypothetical protein
MIFFMSQIRLFLSWAPAQRAKMEMGIVIITMLKIPSKSTDIMLEIFWYFRESSNVANSRQIRPNAKIAVHIYAARRESPSNPKMKGIEAEIPIKIHDSIIIIGALAATI